MPRLPQAKDSLFGSAAFFIPPRSADGRIESVVVQPLTKGHRLHDARVLVRSMTEGAHSIRYRLLVRGDAKIEVEFLRTSIAKLDHLAKLPRCIDVHDGKRQWSRVKSLQC